MIRIQRISTDPADSVEVTDIVRVQWFEPSGVPREGPRSTVADWIDRGNRAYVIVGRQRTEVVTFKHDGEVYLRTALTDTGRDHLLTLSRY